jgi:hypothetical protein
MSDIQVFQVGYGLAMLIAIQTIDAIAALLPRLDNWREQPRKLDSLSWCCGKRDGRLSQAAQVGEGVNA